MLTRKDLVWLLKNLPADVVQYIIASYNPECFFILSRHRLLNYNWTKQSKLTFGLACDTAYEYYTLCLRHRTVKSLQFVCSRRHEAVLDDGEIRVCGYNRYGQLGLGDTGDRSKFQKIENLPKDIIQIACGDLFTLALKSDGVLLYCGLFPGTTYKQTKFYELDYPKDIIQVACGHNHIVILKNDGSLMTCGDNSHGQLGLGDRNPVSKFEKICYLPKNIIQISCGKDYTFILTADGSLMSCGANEQGQLGLGDCYNRLRFEKVNSWCWLDGDWTSFHKDVVKIACGSYHTIIMRADGSLMSCGNNDYRQLGHHSPGSSVFSNIEIPIDIVDMSCNGNYSVVMGSDGTLMSCGSNWNGQLAHGDFVSRYKFTTIRNQPNNIIQICCSYSKTFLVTADKMIMCSGSGGAHKKRTKFETVTMIKI